MDDKIVILLTIDALRPDHLKSYGYFRNTAPNLENFMRSGTRFQNAFTNGPESPSSFAAIFSGILPFYGKGYSPLPDEKITFVQILRENAINTFGIHSNPNLGEYFNYHRGFHTFIDGERYKLGAPNKANGLKNNIINLIKKILIYKNIIERILKNLKGFNKLKDIIREKLPFLTEIILPFAPMAYDAPYIINKVLNHLKSTSGPKFIWAHFMDTHDPYNPPSDCLLKFRSEDIEFQEREYLNKEVYRNPKSYNITTEVMSKLTDLYDGEINYIDNHLSKLFYYIKKNYNKNCLILITADHGESFYEHEYFNHQGNIYDELLRVPLFVIEIGKNSKLNKQDQIVQLIDIPSTIIDYFNVEIPSDFQGKSLLPLMENGVFKRDDITISESLQKEGKMKRNIEEGFKLISIRTKEFKYIYDEEKQKEYFFDLKQDPKEKINLINDSNYYKHIDHLKAIKENHFNDILKPDEKSKITQAIGKVKFNSKL